MNFERNVQQLSANQYRRVVFQFGCKISGRAAVMGAHQSEFGRLNVNATPPKTIIIWCNCAGRRIGRHLTAGLFGCFLFARSH